MKRIIVDRHIFEHFPDFKRGIVVVADIENSPHNSAVAELLVGEIAAKLGKNSVEHEFIKAWDAAHARFGSNPNKFPPSIKSLLKRIDKGGTLPFINTAVALFNYISIKYLIPCGADDIDRVEGNLILGPAAGNEVFVPLGGGETENPKPGEVILYDDRTLNVMCRRWNWRNGDCTKITESTRRLVINLDGISPVPRSLIEEARDELAALLVQQCGAKLTADVLSTDKNEVEIELI